jgi:hypothetical protein
MLRAVLPDTMIIAALDIIDRECGEPYFHALQILQLNDGPSVMKYKTSWGRQYYEVLGTTSTYTVFPHLGAASTTVSSYCTCPSFAYSVLMSENHLMVRIYIPMVTV